MKLSIWRQFSSNHSGGFTIVGEFPTKEDAIKASKRLQEMLESIYLQSIGYDGTEPVQAELDLGKKFDIDWTEHLDWIHTDEFDHVLQFDNYVAVSEHHGSTYQDYLYIDQIMSKLGSKVYGAGHIDVNVIGIELSCVAPNSEVAESIYNELNPYFEAVRAEKDESNSAPWKHFYSLSKYDVMINTDAYYGYVHKNNLNLTFDHLKFGTIGTGLPSLIAYLEDKGCTEINYKIMDVPMKELFEE